MHNPLQLEPTFPLDEQQIYTRTRRSLLEELAPWGIIGGIVLIGLGIVSPFRGFAIIGLGALGYWLHRQYHKNYRKAEARIIGNLVREQNRSQDRQLEDVVAQLRERGLYAYASALGKFILLKQRIEFTLHQDNSPNYSNQELDNLVDRICSLTCDHLAKLTDLDQRVGTALTSCDQDLMKRLVNERVQVLTDIQRAYSMMYECMDSLVNFKASAEGGLPAPSEANDRQQADMDQAINQLEKENQILKRIIQRVQTDLSLPPSPSEIFADEVETEAGQMDSEPSKSKQSKSSTPDKKRE